MPVIYMYVLLLESGKATKVSSITGSIVSWYSVKPLQINIVFIEETANYRLD